MNGAGPTPPRPFSAPWEAQVFAMVLSLHDSGLFTWSDWSQTLGAVIRPHGAPEEASDYLSWLTALEAILASRGIADPARLVDRSAAFERAAAATPHGEPIVLSRDPLELRRNQGPTPSSAT